MKSVVTVNEMVNFYQQENRPLGIVVDEVVIEAQAIKAVKYYLGFGNLSHVSEDNNLTLSSSLNKSEWAVIMPLFELYVERENALILESSRALGVEVYGRSVSEVANDITQKELEIQNLAFSHEFFTV